MQSPKKVAMEMNEAGVLNRGREWTIPLVQRLVRMAVYAGKVEYRGELYEGEQEAIVDDELWRLVRKAIDAATVGEREGHERSLDSIAPLKGVLRCGNCGCAMSPEFTYKRGRKYRFYACQKDAKRAEPICPVRRLSAGDVEGYVFGQLGRLLAAPQVLATLGHLA